MTVWHELVNELHASEINIPALQVPVHAHGVVEVADEEDGEDLLENTLLFVFPEATAQAGEVVVAVLGVFFMLIGTIMAFLILRIK